MTKLEQAARQALESIGDCSPNKALVHAAYALREALEQHKPHEECECNACINYFTDKAQKEALAEQAEQEPVAEVFVRPLRGDQSQPTTDIKWLQRPTTGKLYAAPVRTKDLTGDEILKLCGLARALPLVKERFLKRSRLVIAADREKNK